MTTEEVVGEVEGSEIGEVGEVGRYGAYDV